MASAGGRPVIEAVIRARDEASAVFARATAKINAEGKTLQTTMRDAARSGSDFAGVIGTVAGAASRAPGAIGMVARAVQVLSAAWVQLGPIVGAVMGQMEDAAKKQAALIAQQAKDVGDLRKAAIRTATQEERGAEADRRAALARDDAAGAAAALKRTQEAIDKRADLERRAVIAERAQATQAAFEKGEKLSPARGAIFDERLKQVEMEAARDRADLQNRLDQEAQRNAEEARRREEQATQRREREAVKLIDLSKRIALAQIEAQTTAAAAEEERAGRIDRMYERQLEGINRARDAELAAINATADARARAATGPDREEQVLAIRREQSFQQAAVRAGATRDAEDARQDALRALDRQDRQREQQRTREAKERTTFARDMLGSVEQTYAANEAMLGQPGVRDTAALDRMIEANRLRRDIELNEIQSRGAAEEVAAMQDLVSFKQRRGLERAAPGGAETPGTPLQVTRDAAGNAVIATDFAKAAESAAKLTASVKDLGAALKELETSPGFAAKLSQDLADTLQFLGGRNP